MKGRTSSITTGDRIVIAVAVSLVAALYTIYWPSGHAGTIVEYQTPLEHGRLLLERDRTVELEGTNGVSHIEIHDNAVRFTASPCRNKYCIHSGWLRNTHDFAACLPNQVSLRIVSQNASGLDAINY